MAVVIMSAARFSGGGAIAERTAELLSYRLVGREVLKIAAGRYGVSERLLTQAVDGRSTWRPLSTKDRRVCLAFIQAALSDSLLAGDCVCHRLASHLFVTGISHVVKVRVRAPLEARISEAVRRRGLEESKANRAIRRLDARRQRWVSDLHGLDEDDPANFDLMVDRATTSIEEAATLVAETALESRFKPVSFSLKQVRDLALASRVLAALVRDDSEVKVRADDGVIHIEAPDRGRASRKAARFEERALAVPGVENVEVTMIEDVFAKAAVSMR
jgi:hypothetical protein